MFFFPNPDYSYFSENLTIRSSEPVKIPDIKTIFKIISGHNLEIPDVWQPFRRTLN